MPIAPFLASIMILLASALGHAQQPRFFDRVATIEAIRMLPADRDRSGKSIAEIVAATADGMTLVYVDGEQKGIGFVDIADPAAPRPAGFVPMAGEPNSVAVRGTFAYAVVDMSANKREVAGHVSVVDIAARREVMRCELGGQPDAVAIGPDGRFLVVAIENERDESVGRGAIPQLPAGYLAILPLSPSGLDCAGLRRVDLTGLAAVAPEDPEPEFVDVNARGEAVVTLQENNHIVIVDVASARVVAHFPAGMVDLEAIDATRDGVIRPTQRLAGVVREPDAVKWLDDERFVTANEGDYRNGSRGFTIFRRDGSVEWDSGNRLEHLAIALGHYPELRSASRGNEPEGIEVGVFDGERLIFVGSERASIVTVWRDEGAGIAPTLLQTLPTGVGPEGLLAIPSRGLFVAAAEADNPETGLRSTLTIYRRGTGPSSYPTILSGPGPDGVPMAWGALSGLAADREIAGRLFAVTDSFYAEARILTVDATVLPARIVAAATVSLDGKPAPDLDIEGIATREDGGFWLVSEGNPERREGVLRIDSCASRRMAGSKPSSACRRRSRAMPCGSVSKASRRSAGVRTKPSGSPSSANGRMIRKVMRRSCGSARPPRNGASSTIRWATPVPAGWASRRSRRNRPKASWSSSATTNGASARSSGSTASRSPGLRRPRPARP